MDNDKDYDDSEEGRQVVQDDAFGHYAARGRGGRSAAAEAEEEEEQQAEKLALQLSFVLPPAAFATSLVRCARRHQRRRRVGGLGEDVACQAAERGEEGRGGVGVGGAAGRQKEEGKHVT
eukprot:2376126-Rhodomonas_salina.1